jgi:chromosome segregation ATPase
MAMSAQHKAALAQGRREGRAVKQYLEALGSRRPGRPVTPERLRDKIASLETRIAEEMDPLKALEMRQERLDAEAALARAEATEDFAALEAAFVEHARSYSERKGISYSAWRESGVAADVLRRAGIPRTRG